MDACDRPTSGTESKADETQSSAPPLPDYFLVCGLGSLGQHCVMILREFGVQVGAIEQVQPEIWDIPEVQQQLEHLWVGDCRQAEILKQAGIERCRAILLVTSDDQVNIETAFAARLLNPQVRLVVRSAKQNLNDLLEQQLGNFVAFEPTQLSTHALTLAALGQDILGLFQLAGERFRVVRHRAKAGDRWCHVRRVHELNSSSRRVLLYQSATAPLPSDLPPFYDWNPLTQIEPGDLLVTLEVFHGDLEHLPDATAPAPSNASQLLWPFAKLQRWNTSLRTWWQERAHHQIQRVILTCSLMILGLVGLGTLLFWRYYPDLQMLDAFAATSVLLLGGYGDLFGELAIAETGIPQWLRLFGLLLTLAGTAFVGVLYALLTQRLLTLRLDFLDRRSPLPTHNHIVVIGLGRVGQRVIQLLQELNQAVVGVASQPVADSLLGSIPLVIGDQETALTKVNLETARSVVAVTAAELQNLELALMAHAANPICNLVIRTYNRRFNDNIARLFPYAHVLCVSALSAEAFAAAAFGENILSLFRLQNRTILVTEYRIEAGDSLEGLLLAEVAYGYGVVPILHERDHSELHPLMPSEDRRLDVGDRLVVLATTASLQRIERAERAERDWEIWIERVLNPAAVFDGATELARVSGCDMRLARHTLTHVPTQLPRLLYKHQALRLVRRLHRLQIIARATHRTPDRPGITPDTQPSVS
jgi:Trk K+ transport system NAD-binding subunit